MARPADAGRAGGVAHREACRREVGDVARDHRHAMNQSGRSDQYIALGSRIGNV